MGEQREKRLTVLIPPTYSENRWKVHTIYDSTQWLFRYIAQIATRSPSTACRSSAHRAHRLQISIPEFLPLGRSERTFLLSSRCLEHSSDYHERHD